MKIITDPGFDYRKVVKTGYDTCAEAYLAARSTGNLSSLDNLMDNLAAGAEILDLGCGSGLPVSAKLAMQYSVTGIDISPRQITLARNNVPGAVFICCDILDYAPEPGTFDAIVSYYTLFHLPRDRHAELLTRCGKWLKPDGYLLITVARDDEPGYTEDDFFGTTMYWSHYGEAYYLKLLKNLGFRNLEKKIISHGYGEKEITEEKHLLIFAGKKAETIR